MIKLMGIDSSSSVTGWSLFCDGKYHNSGIINFKKEKDNIVRFDNMIRAIWELLNENSPTIIAIENTVVVRNAESQRKLSMILGSVYTWCLLNGCEYVSLRPTEWRSLISKRTGGKKRDELKAWSKYQVSQLFKLEVSDDESDAILIAQALINRFDNLKK